MTNYIPDIPLEELVRIKKDIEGTKLKNGRSTSDTEFSWLYRLSQPLEILERIATSPESSALQIIGVGAESPDYTNTDALAHIHNHPSGLVIPTNGDISYFLRSIQRNQDLRYELIASTSEGVVSGFYVMEYTGDRESISKKLTQLDKCFQGHAKKRKKEMEDFPDSFLHIGVGDSIFTQEEYAKISLELMELAGVKHYAVAIPSYKFQDWQFIKE